MIDRFLHDRRTHTITEEELELLGEKIVRRVLEELRDDPTILEPLFVERENRLIAAFSKKFFIGLFVAIGTVITGLGTAFLTKTFRLMQ